MKFPCTLKNALLILRDRFGLAFASKWWGYLAAYLLLLSLLARYKLSCYQTTRYLQFQHLQTLPYWKLLVISFCSSLGSTLLLIEKSYNWSPILVGHQGYFLAPLPGSEAPLVRKHLYSVLKFIITIKSHFCKWSWRDWQPLYRVGCEVLICLCRCMGLERDLLLDWYLGSQKLREILTLLYCIILSSSGKSNAVLKR